MLICNNGNNDYNNNTYKNQNNRSDDDINADHVFPEPWTMQWSKSQNKKYFFNLRNGQSRFDCPLDSIASVK